MKKNLLFTAVIFALSVFSSNAQSTYAQWGLNSNGDDWDTLYNSGETSNFDFTGIPAGAYGNAKLIFYVDGGFDVPWNYAAILDLGTDDYLGSYDGNWSNPTCQVDSIIIDINTADILNYQSAGIWSVYVAPYSVDFICGANNDMARFKVRLVFEYCSFGHPVEFASFTNASTSTCATSSPLTLTGSPAGGTFSGTNVTGNTFNPMGLAPGSYELTYTATDGIGCVTSTSKFFSVGNAPMDISALVCEGGYAPAIEPLNKEFVFAYDLGLTNAIDTATAYVYGPVVNSPEVIYYAQNIAPKIFTLDNVTTNNALIIDHDNLTGDDRGGLAVTNNFVYVVGDDYTGRYDLNLQTTGTALPVRDGLFSDLQEMKIWSLYNTVSGEMPFDNDNSGLDYTVDAIIALDDDLNMTNEIVMLSTPIEMYNTNNGIFAGFGKVGLYNGDTEDFNIVDLNTGEVTFVNNLYLDLQGSENWSDWGTLSFDGTDYFANYVNYGTVQIESHNLTTDVTSEISSFSDFGQTASIIYHPGNGRLYFHTENSCEFGGDEETLGYIDADATEMNNPNPIFGCPAMIEYTFNSIDLGNDVTICGDQTPLILEAGFGYSSYTWNGVNNNWNIYPVSSTGTYTVEAIDAANCVVTDQIVVTVDQGCVANVDELASQSFNVYPVPNNGKFVIDFSIEMDVQSVVLVLSLIHI